MNSSGVMRGKGLAAFTGRFWQRNYYEHIIRSEEEMTRIREYIINNPLKWSEDENNPAHIPMTTQPLTIHSWPRAILHVDADAFFASCEQAIHPELKGRPVITGKERGIVAAASYEAKAKGIKRGMRLFEVRKVCPDAVILPSDYETYSLFSLRMFEIFRRFSPDVEEYSIDEAFVDLTGLRRSFHGPYGMIAEKMQLAIEKELGITVSIGVSLSKVLAKIGSKHNKPHGCTIIPGRDIHLYLEELPVEKVWGIGANTAAYLNKHRIATALQFAMKDEKFIKKYLSKPYQEIWHELTAEAFSLWSPSQRAVTSR